MKVTQAQIARRLGLDASSVNKILNRRDGPHFSKRTIKRVLREARRMGFDFERLKHRHVRRHPRTGVRVAARVQVFDREGALFDEGEGVLLDLSPSGARVAGLSLPRGELPLAPFVLGLRPLSNPALEVRGRVVRFDHEEGLALGIEFLRPEYDLHAALAH